MTGPIPVPDIDSSFVGRTRELNRFRAALDATIAGRRQILLLCGEPGIGTCGSQHRSYRRAASIAPSTFAVVASTSSICRRIIPFRSTTITVGK